MNQQTSVTNHAKKPLAIYVHIPFCVKKCNYCDFLSGPADRKSKAEYIEALIHEIHSYGEFAKDYMVKTIFIGGGTPSSIEETQIAAIMKALEEVFCFRAKDNQEMEITIEINPGAVTEEKLRTYWNAGINRISFGLQSANNEELKMLGRIHTFEEFLDNYHLARKVGFSNINIDLMSALPGQTMESYLNTLKQIIALQPEHISAYSLIIEEGTPFYELYGDEKSQTSEPKLPSEEVDRKMYETTRQLMHEHGYERYEISNYAKTGYECKHNCTYWLREDYLGIRNGAASLIRNERFSNERDLKTYIELAKTYIELAGKNLDVEYHKNLHGEVEMLEEKAQMEEFMFLGLRMMEGVSVQKFKESFQKDLFEVYGDVITTLIDKKLLEEKNGHLALSEYGIDISNYVMSEFLFDEE